MTNRSKKQRLFSHPTKCLELVSWILNKLYFCRRKRFKLGNGDKDLEDELSAILNVNNFRQAGAPVSQAPPPPMVPPMPPPAPPMPPPMIPSFLPPRPLFSQPPFSPNMLPPIDMFALRSHALTTPTFSTPMLSMTKPAMKKKGGFDIDSLIDTTRTSTSNEEDVELPVMATPPSVLVPPPSSLPNPPFLPPFHFHMAAMAALAANNQPFLEFPREEARTSTFSPQGQQMSPRSDISSCSNSSSINSLNGDLFPVNLSSNK